MYLLKRYITPDSRNFKNNSHSTMYLLKQVRFLWNPLYAYNSHSTMYLLKRSYSRCSVRSERTFTFHHVSIKTWIIPKWGYIKYHSHSTMYLLKRIRLLIIIIMIQNSHSTMYLLKRLRRAIQNHYKCNSHSTMYLLKLLRQIDRIIRQHIHIPPCIY